MADRYWVGGTANWNATAGTKWALTSGGAGGQAVPTSSDDVFFDAASGSVTVTVNANVSCKNLTMTNFAGTFTATASFDVYGGMTIGASTIFSTNSTISFKATSGTNTITSSGDSFANVNFDGVGGTWQLGDALISTGTVTLTNGTLNANNQNLTCAIFSSSNSNVRALTMGSGTWTLTGTGTIWNQNTSTNMTLNVGTSTIVCNNSSSSSRTISFGSHSVSFYNLNVTAGTGDFDLSGNASPGGNNVDFTGFAGVLVAGASWNLTGNLTFGSGMTATGGQNTINLIGTSGTQSIDTKGITVNRSLTINNSGATASLASALVLHSTGSLTLTAGVFDANNQNLTIEDFSSSNSNTRTLTMGSGTWTLTNSSGTLWSTSTITNLTFNAGTSTISLTTNTASTRVISSNSSLLLNNISVTAGTGGVTLTNVNANNIDLTGQTGALSTNAFTFRGNLTLGTGMSVNTTANAITYAGTSGTGVLTSNGVTINRPLTINGVGGTLQLADDLTLASTRTLTLTNGTFDANDQDLSIGAFSSSNSNTRALLMGSGTWSITSNGLGILAWDTGTTTGMTFDSGSSLIKLEGTRTDSDGFTGGGLTFNNLWDASTGSFELYLSGSNTFDDLKVNGGRSIYFEGGTTQTVSSFTVSGSLGNLVTLASQVDGQSWYLSRSPGNVDVEYVSLQDSTAIGGAIFTATNSVNVSNNVGWHFPLNWSNQSESPSSWSNESATSSTWINETPTASTWTNQGRS